MAVLPTSILLPINANYAADEYASSFIAFAQAEMNETEWGTLYSQGVAYLAAHLMMKAAQGLLTPGSGSESGGAIITGMVTRKRAGDIDESYASPGLSTSWSASSAAEADLMSTVYGQQFYRLRRLLATRAPKFYGVV